MAHSVPDTPGPLPKVDLPQPHRGLRPWIALPIAVLLMVAGGLAVWYSQPRIAASKIRLSGRIEGYETDMGARVAGRITQVTVREGDRVTPDQLLVRLEDTEAQARLEGVNARLSAAEQREQNASLQMGVVESQILETQIAQQQAEGAAQGQVLQAEGTVAEAIAQLRQAEAQVSEMKAQLELAAANRDRLAQLVQAGAISQQAFDEAQTALQTAQATLRSREAVVEAAQQRVAAAQGGLTQAQTTQLNPDIRTAQITRLSQQLKQVQVQLAIAEAEVASAEADRQEVLAQLAFLNIKSPINGVVTARNVEPGSVVAAGQTLLSLLDLDTVYLRGYIPAGDIGNIRIGQRASVYLDSAPKQALSAQVAAIDAQASFTPENIYFQDDRVRQVFGVNLSIENPDGFAKPGMPADADIWLGSGG
jgi:HlyD family secretion protein